MLSKKQHFFLISKENVVIDPRCFFLPSFFLSSFLSIEVITETFHRKENQSKYELSFP